MEQTENRVSLLPNPSGNQPELSTHQRHDTRTNSGAEDRANNNDFVFGSSPSETASNDDNDNNSPTNNYHDNYVAGIYVSGCICL